jgi:hypothetical protein
MAAGARAVQFLKSLSEGRVTGKAGLLEVENSKIEEEVMKTIQVVERMRGRREVIFR